MQDVLKQLLHLTERLHNKSFWIWNVDEHKQEDVRTIGYCCFNHIIGLSGKDSVDKPLYIYQKTIFDVLSQLTRTPVNKVTLVV